MIDRYHPDKNANSPEASEVFKEVAYAYGVVSDPEKRKQYDNAGFEVVLSALLSLSVFSLCLSVIFLHSY